MLKLFLSCLLCSSLITTISLFASEQTNANADVPWNMPRCGNWQSEVNKKIISHSKHDLRLKGFAYLYYSMWSRFDAQPLDCYIMQNLYWQQSVPCPLNIYNELLTKTKKLLNKTWPTIINFAQYLQEQYDTKMEKCCLIVQLLKSTSLPPEVQQQSLYAFDDQNEEFKTELLIMFRICSRGKPQNLPAHLFNYYKQIHTLYN